MTNQCCYRLYIRTNDLDYLVRHAHLLEPGHGAQNGELHAHRQRLAFAQAEQSGDVIDLAVDQDDRGDARIARVARGLAPNDT